MVMSPLMFILLREEFVSFLQGYGVAMNMVWFYPKKKKLMALTVSLGYFHLLQPVL